MTTATETAGLVGADVDRVDGPSKVTGAARYPADFGLENLAHAVLVQSTVAAGRIRRMATAAAEAAPGVLTVITHRNAPRLARAPNGLGIGPPPPLQDDRVRAPWPAHCRGGGADPGAGGRGGAAGRGRLRDG